MTILVADDNLASRELMRELLEASGHRVVEATNGREALTSSIEMPPRCCVPGFANAGSRRLLCGSPTAKRRAFPPPPAVAVTASAMLGDRELAIAAGFDSYITKPINLNEVRRHAEQLTAGSYRPQD